MGSGECCLICDGAYLQGRGAGCLSSVVTYLPGSKGQECRLFKWCWNLPLGHFGAGVLGFTAVSEYTSRALCGRGARYLRGIRTYLPGTVGQRCRLFKRCQNLPPVHCGEGVQAI